MLCIHFHFCTSIPIVTYKASAAFLITPLLFLYKFLTTIGLALAIPKSPIKDLTELRIAESACLKSTFLSVTISKAICLVFSLILGFNGLNLFILVYTPREDLGNCAAILYS